jgi:formylmethanofuran dehydrogenase subunit E
MKPKTPLDELEMIPKRDAALYIDVYCYQCKRLIALSNAIQLDGRYYCQRCR